MEFSRSRDDRDSRGGRPQNRENRERIPIRGQHSNSPYQSIPLRPAHPQRYPSSNSNFDYSPSYWRPESASNLPPRPTQRYRSPPPLQSTSVLPRNWEGRPRERDGRSYGREELVAPRPERTEPRASNWREPETSRNERENRDRRPNYQESRGRSSFDIPYRVGQSSKRPRSSSEDEEPYSSSRGRSRANSVEYRSRNSVRATDSPRRVTEGNTSKPSYMRLEERLRRPSSPTPSDKSSYDPQSRDQRELSENRLPPRSSRRSYSPGEISEGPTRSISPQSRSHSVSLATDPRSRSRTRTPTGSRERSGTPPLSLRSDAASEPRVEEQSLLKRMNMGDLRNEREMKETINDSLWQGRQTSETSQTLSTLSPRVLQTLPPKTTDDVSPPSLALRLCVAEYQISPPRPTVPLVPTPPIIVATIPIDELTPQPQSIPSPPPPPPTAEPITVEAVSETPPNVIPTVSILLDEVPTPVTVFPVMESLLPFNPVPLSPPITIEEDVEMKSIPIPVASLILPLPPSPIPITHTPVLSPPSPPPSPPAPLMTESHLDLSEKMEIELTIERQQDREATVEMEIELPRNFSTTLSKIIVANSKDDGLVNSIIFSNRLHSGVISLPVNGLPSEFIENQDFPENSMKMLPFLSNCFKVRDDRRAEKAMQLRREYKDLNSDWLGHCKRLEKVKSKNSRRASGTGVDENGVPFYSETTSAALPSMNVSAVGAGGRPNRRNPNYGYGDAVRSEAEFLEILASLENADMQDPGMRATRTAAVVPDMIIDSTEGVELNLFEDRRRLVEDPSEFYELGKPVEIWTELEVEKFCEAFSSFPKQFGKVSSAVESKTTAECVRFYYRMKTTIDFRSLSDRRGRDGRRRKLRRRGEESGKSSLMSNLKRVGEKEEEEEEEEEEQVTEKKTPKLRDTLTLSVPSTSTSTPNSIHPPSDSMMEAAETLGALFSISTNDEEKKRRKSNTSSSYWSVAERNNFIRLLGVYGKDWGRLAGELESKTAVQCRNWFQNHSKKLNLSDIVKNVVGSTSFAEDGDDDSGSGAVTPAYEYTAPLGLPLSEAFGNGLAIPQVGFFNTEPQQPPVQRITSGKGILSLLNEDDRLVDEQSVRADGEDWFGGGGLEETDDEAEFVKKDIDHLPRSRTYSNSISSPKKDYSRLPPNSERESHYPILFPHSSPMPQPLNSWQPRPVQYISSPYNQPTYPPTNEIGRIRTNSTNSSNGDFLRRSEHSPHQNRRDLYPHSMSTSHLPMPLVPVNLPGRHLFPSQGKTIYDRNGFQPRSGFVSGGYGNGNGATGWLPPPEPNGQNGRR